MSDSSSRKSSQKGMWTKEALCLQRELKLAKDAALKEAVEWMRAAPPGESRGVVKAAKQFPSLTSHQIRYAFENPVVERNKYDILTRTELEALNNWIKLSDDHKAAPSFMEVSKKVRQLLLARELFNRKKHHGTGSTPLTNAERVVVNDPHYLVSKTWHQRNIHSQRDISLKVPKEKDAKRAAKMREDVVQRHFFGLNGLEAELIDAGIMDPETKEILDRRRLLNWDEMPCFLDYVDGQLQKVYGRAGRASHTSTTQNRETATVNMSADLGGFIYHPQFLLPRAHLTTAMGDCYEAPESCKKFNDQIYLIDGKSTYSLISPTPKGIQTGESLLNHLKLLRTEINERNRLEVRSCPPLAPPAPSQLHLLPHFVLQVLAGNPPIVDPIVHCVDNHSSRFDEAVQKACNESAASLGFRLFFEESLTSHFLQMWDQINAAAHTAYRKGRNEYKQQYKLK